MRNKDNDYMLDRHMQRTHNYTGLPGNRAQDQAVTESMGEIVNRPNEHLGAADTAIIVMRRLLMRMARAVEAGIEPELVMHPERFPNDTHGGHDGGGGLPATLGSARAGVQA